MPSSADEQIRMPADQPRRSPAEGLTFGRLSVTRRQAGDLRAAGVRRRDVLDGLVHEYRAAA